MNKKYALIASGNIPLISGILIALLIWIASPVFAQEGYLLKIGDELELDILDDSDPPQRFIVGSDGAVRLPLIGGLEVANLSLQEARARIRQTYVDRQVFINPTVDLSIAAYRPVFVTGDVRNPGFYEFRLYISAEQALGLAGGPVVPLNNAETRILERRALEGSLASVQADLARFATEYARIRAQVQGRDEVRWDDMPTRIRPLVDQAVFLELKPVEDEIIVLERRNHETQSRLLREAIVESENEIILLAARESAQATALERTQEDIARGQALTERGVQASGTLSQLHRLGAEAEDLLFQIRGQQTAARRRLGELQREYSRLESDRAQRLLSEGQSRWSEIAKLESDRLSIIDRLDLLRQWITSAANAELEARVEYRVRRRAPEGVTTFDVDGLAELLPGDLLIVTVRPADAFTELTQ
ncbi:polysaccharide biosynthesis/export family protein [Pararhodobacter sp.]|uniref:polysaccharide biosynthesis/export family protein n=1 Tax=Pararhodobacter sp. TaxID=2127056 RepID=UPI002FDDD539